MMMVMITVMMMMMVIMVMVMMIVMVMIMTIIFLVRVITSVLMDKNTVWHDVEG